MKEIIGWKSATSYFSYFRYLVGYYNYTREEEEKRIVGFLLPLLVVVVANAVFRRNKTSDIANKIFEIFARGKN